MSFDFMKVILTKTKICPVCFESMEQGDQTPVKSEKTRDNLAAVNAAEVGWRKVHTYIDTAGIVLTVTYMFRVLM